MPRLMKATAFAIALAVAPIYAVAQAPPSPPPFQLTAETRAQVIEAAARQLEQSYVSAEIGARMADVLRSSARRGAYERISGAAEFAAALTRDLQQVHPDGHLAVSFSAEPIPPPETRTAPSPEMRERMARMARYVNFGFERVDRLAGNVGYIELNGFAAPEEAAETAIAAMRLLSHTDALIIDLRYNGGGVPGIAQLISTYLFDGRPVHLHSIHWREGDRVEQFWTLPHVPGPRYVDKPVYILTSRNTVSAPESFAYSLRAQDRVRIVGERTGGAANPGRMFRLSEHFTIFVPTGRAVNPVTGTNWEGGGITPDIAVPAAGALRAAHLDFLRSRLETASSPQQRAQIQSAIDEVEGQ